MDYLDYLARLGIGFNDKEKQNIFINRIQVFLKSNITAPFSEAQERNFCYAIGMPCLLENKPLFDFDFDNTDPVGYQRTWLYLRQKSDFLDFLASLIIFANGYCGPKSQKNKVQKFIKSALKDSHIEYDLYEDEDGVFFFPKGAEELDEALVSQPLAWLSEYPNTRKTYEIALQQYAEGKYIRDVADNLRKALEEFLKECFCLHGNFGVNIKAVFAYLGEQKIDPQLAGMIRTLLNEYEKLNNEIAKHNDKVDERYLEFLIYQTGIFLRFLIQVKKAEKEA